MEVAVAVDVDAVASKMLQRAVDGTPAKRLIATLVKAAAYEALRKASLGLTLHSARLVTSSPRYGDCGLIHADPSNPQGHQGLGVKTKLKLLEIRETALLFLSDISFAFRSQGR